MGDGQPITVDLKIGGFAVRMVSMKSDIWPKNVGQDVLCRKKQDLEGGGHNGTLR